MGCVEDVYRVCLRILWDVYVWSIGVRYIYLISVILNVYVGYIYIYNFAHILYLFHILIGLERQYVWFAAYCSLRIRFHFTT